MEVSERFFPVRMAYGLLLLAGISACGGGGGGVGSPAPTVTIGANPVSVAVGGASDVTWSSTNATSCTASGNWAGTKATSGNESLSPINATSTFTLSCTGTGGTRQASVIVTVVPAATVTLSANPLALHAGATSHLTWSSTSATDCQATGGWTGTRPTNGGEDVGPIAADTTYTLTCNGIGGSSFANATVLFRPGANLPPTADAGADQTVTASGTVTLVGNASDDFGISLYTWAQTAGPAVTLIANSPSVSHFTAPLVGAATVLTFSLVVTDDEGAVSAPDTVDITVNPVPATVQVEGDIDYQRVPFNGGLGFGLYYQAQAFTQLHATVLVEALDATSNAVLASGRFAQHYAFTLPSVTNVKLRVTAATSRQSPDPLPHWDVSVRDLNDSGVPVSPIYTYITASFSTAAGGVQDIQIPSGWDVMGTLTGTRAAAPFAILDTIEMGLERVLSVSPTADFPALTVDWSPTNTGGNTYFSHDPSGRRIVLSGETNVDTDEYDPGVILHEYGHYVDDVFARSDSVGGPHSIDDRLDPRVAFGEGLATAFSSMSRLDTLYRDSFGANQANDFGFDIETDRAVVEGWYSESSTQELLWDAYDNVNDGADAVSLGFGPLWNAWTGNVHSQTAATTTLFSFFTALQQDQPASASSISNLLAGEGMVGTAIDAYGSTETNNAGNATDVLPVYTTIALGETKVLRSTNVFGTDNKLSTHRFLRFSLLAQTNVKFDLSAVGVHDPDIAVLRHGLQLAPDMGPSNESFTLSLPADDYVLDIYECGNAGCNPTVPAGPTDLTISVTPN